MVPNIAAPNELPTVRKNVTPEVATPKSRYCTVFSTTRVNTCIDSAMPIPRTSKDTDTRHTGVS